MVHDAHVARAHEAIGCEGLGGFFGLVEIAGHHIGATNTNFARAANGQAFACVVFDGDVDAGQRQTDVAAEVGLCDRVVGANGAGLAHAPAFDHGAAGSRLPVARCAFGCGHASGLCQSQRGKVDRLEHRVLHQGVEQGVDPGQHVKSPLFEHPDELGKVTRVGHQRQMRALTDGQQTQCQGKDVVQRQCRNAVDFAQIANAGQGRGEPAFGLQNGGHHIAVGQHCAFGQAGRPAGVLQKRHVIQRLVCGFQAQVAALRNGFLERGDRPSAIQRQLEFGHHFGQVTHGKSHPAAIPGAQQVADRGQHHVLHGGVPDHFLQVRCKVFQNDDGVGTGILELVF